MADFAGLTDKGALSPGVAKQITGRIDSFTGLQSACMEGGLVEATDTEVWQMRFENSGESSLDNYTITDTMQYPFYFTGDLTYTLTSSRNSVYSTTRGYNTSSWNTGYKDQLLMDITFVDSTGAEITKPLKEYPEGEVSVLFKTMSANTVGSYYTYSGGLGEEISCRAYWYGAYSNSSTYGNFSSLPSAINSGYNTLLIDFKVTFDIDDDGNCILQMVFDEGTHGRLGIAPGGYVTMTAQTKKPQATTIYSSFVNTVMLTPNEDYDAENVTSGTVVRDEAGEPAGIAASSMFTVSGAYTTTSWKTITDNSDPTNTASSRDVNNYIVLLWDEEQNPPYSDFTYSLNVENMCEEAALSKLIIIDNLPEEGDHMAYSNGASMRNSEFMVMLSGIDDEFFSVVDQEETLSRVDRVDGIDGSDTLVYTIEFSTATEFDDADWDGEENPDKWMSFAETQNKVAAGELKIEDIRSYRVIVGGGDGIAQGNTLSVFVNAEIFGTVQPREIAWNNFGYQYFIEAVGSVFSLSASSLNVGVMTATTPRIKKVLTSGTGREITAEELGASAEFLIYQDSQIQYEDEQSLLEALYENQTEFTVFTLTAEQIDAQEYVDMSGCVKYQVQLDTNGIYSYLPTEDTWNWVEGEAYTVTEVDLPENIIFSTMQGSQINGYTFTYNRNGRYNISCVNIYDDYNITLRKTGAEDKTPLEGAAFARYGVITGNPDDPEYQKDLEALWEQYVDDYIAAVGITETYDEDIYCLAAVGSERLQAARDAGYESFCQITGVIDEISSISETGQNFCQMYQIQNEDGTETTYYFIDYAVTDADGYIRYTSVVDDQFAYLEVAAPVGYSLLYRLNISERNAISGATQYVDISDSYAEKLPMTGGRGTLYMMLFGVAAMLFSTGVVAFRVKRKED